MLAQIDAVDVLALVLKAEAAKFLKSERLIAFEIAVVEALTNSVIHGCADLPDAVIQVTLEPGAGRVDLVICDPGLPAPTGTFDTARPLDEIDPLAESGRGVSLILHYADALRYHSHAGLNYLELTFTMGGPV